jgi:hypothetical protein
MAKNLLANPVSRNQAHHFSPQDRADYGSLEEKGTQVVAGHQVSVEVKYHLAATTVYIDEEAIPRLIHAKLTSNRLGYCPDMCEDFIVLGNIVECRYVLFRDN